MKAGLPDVVVDALARRWQAHEGDGSSAASTSDALYTTLAAAITAREVPPNVPLREELLASVFHVSRTPVREALVRLESVGLLARDERGRLRVEQVSPERTLEVYTVRTVLDGLCARVAAQIHSPALPNQLTRLNELMMKSAEAGDFRGASEASTEFHAAIAQATRNQVLIDIMNIVHLWISRIESTTLSTEGRAAEAFAQHAKIAEAIREGDATKAEEFALRHMQDAEQIRLRMLQNAP